LKRDYNWLSSLSLRESNVIFYPHLRNTLHGAALGKIINLSDKENDESLMQAIMEGVAFEVKRFIDRLVYINNDQVIEEFITVGGTTFNKPFMRILTDVLGKPLKVLEQAEYATNLGAAMLSAVVSKEITYDYVKNNVRRFRSTIFPEGERRKKYFVEKYERYIDSY
jgi:sugar (pentulose or hexulose) kinase